TTSGRVERPACQGALYVEAPQVHRAARWSLLVGEVRRASRLSVGAVSGARGRSRDLGLRGQTNRGAISPRAVRLEATGLSGRFRRSFRGRADLEKWRRTEHPQAHGMSLLLVPRAFFETARISVPTVFESFLGSLKQ